MAPLATMPFVFERAEVRVVMRDGAPWFVLADVCLVLGLDNVSMVAKRLDEDEKQNGVSIVDPMGGDQKATAINESGFYSTILTSRKEGARWFKEWATGEVLPSIRKDGGYMLARPEELAARAIGRKAGRPEAGAQGL